MKPKISLITLGARDLPRMIAFYRDGLGFPTHNYTPGDDMVMFALEGTWLGLFPREALAAGATWTKPPQDVFWGGYSGYFADPEGNLWEVAWNPFTDLT